MIAADHLTKRYGGHVAVDDVSFVCEPGTVTGFLGPNGAGKSTTMRMLCGLTIPSGGSATVLGAPYAALPDPGRRVGVLLDASAQHAGRTGQEVLAVSAQVMGIERKRVETCSAPSAWTSARRRSASARTPWACASAWASPTRCSASPRC